jgi:hypothetical protein
LAGLPCLPAFLASAALAALPGAVALVPLAPFSGAAEAGLFFPANCSVWAVVAATAANYLACLALKSIISFLYFSLALSDST